MQIRKDRVGEGDQFTLRPPGENSYLGVNRILVIRSPKENNPSGFYYKLGFTETGEVIDGEIVAAIEL